MNDDMALIDSKEQQGYNEAYLNEKIAKATKSWKGIDVDKYMDEIRGREPVVLTPENRPDLFDENGHIDWGKLNPPPNVSTSPELNKIEK